MSQESHKVFRRCKGNVPSNQIVPPPPNYIRPDGFKVIPAMLAQQQAYQSKVLHDIINFAMEIFKIYFDDFFRESLIIKKFMFRLKTASTNRHLISLIPGKINLRTKI